MLHERIIRLKLISNQMKLEATLDWKFSTFSFQFCLRLKRRKKMLQIFVKILQSRSQILEENFWAENGPVII